MNDLNSLACRCPTTWLERTASFRHYISDARRLLPIFACVLDSFPQNRLPESSIASYRAHLVLVLIGQVKGQTKQHRIAVDIHVVLAPLLVVEVALAMDQASAIFKTSI